MNERALRLSNFLPCTVCGFAFVHLLSNLCSFLEYYKTVFPMILNKRQKINSYSQFKKKNPKNFSEYVIKAEQEF